MIRAVTAGEKGGRSCELYYTLASHFESVEASFEVVESVRAHVVAIKNLRDVPARVR